MLYCKNDWARPNFLHGGTRGLMFHAPDTGANATTGASGNGGNVTSQPAGAGGEQQQQQSGLYDTIDWDKLDPQTRTVLEAARTDHQRLATEAATHSTQLEQERQRTLQLQQQLGAPPRTETAKEPDPILDGITATLRSKGFTQAQIDQQAPILADVMKSALPTFRAAIGHDLAPLAGSVIAHENTNNFTVAQQDPIGMAIFADPEVAQAVWNVVEQQTKAGKTFSPDAVLNYAKMVYTEHQFTKLNGNNQQQQQQQQQPPATSAFFPQMNQPAPINRSTGGFSFPGANLRPLVSGTPASTGVAVNEETRVALAATFADLSRTTGVAPAAFPSDRASHGAGARAPQRR